jgi:hypothetical protein
MKATNTPFIAAPLIIAALLCSACDEPSDVDQDRAASSSYPTLHVDLDEEGRIQPWMSGSGDPSRGYYVESEHDVLIGGRPATGLVTLAGDIAVSDENGLYCACRDDNWVSWSQLCPDGHCLKCCEEVGGYLSWCIGDDGWLHPGC